MRAEIKAITRKWVRFGHFRGAYHDRPARARSMRVEPLSPIELRPEHRGTRTRLLQAQGQSRSRPRRLPAFRDPGSRAPRWAGCAGSDHMDQLHSEAKELRHRD